jgi:hypothetical protein
MKLTILATTLAIATTSVIVPAHAGTKDYIRICANPRLSLADRTACKSEMLAATTDSARTQLFHLYDRKTAGFAMDGTRGKPVQEAEAVMK